MNAPPAQASGAGGRRGQRRIQPGDLGALAAGLGLPFAFSPYDIWPLALLSPALLFMVWLGAGPARAAWRGWLYGIGSFGVGVSWIHESFQFSNIGLALAIPLTAGFIVFLSLYPAVAGYLCGRLADAGPVMRLGIVYPAAWVLIEWLRGWLLSGFTWLQLGYSQLDAPLRGWFPVTGVYGVSYVLALSAGALAAVLCLLAPRFAPSTGGGSSSASFFALLLAAVLCWPLGWYMTGAVWTTQLKDPIDVALVQGNIGQAEKWRPEWREPTLDRYREFTRAHANADLVIWPETALPGALHTFKPYLHSVAREAAASGTEVLLGVPVVEGGGTSPGQRYFNSVVLLGQEPGFYHKQHLVPFGEFLPLRALLQPVVEALSIPVSQFSPGPPVQPLLQAAGHPFALAICYEIAFGSEIAKALPAARFLVTVSNDAWFGTSIGPHQHQQIARARALEAGRFLVRATNTGVTAIVGPDGQVQAQLPQFEAGVLTGRIFAREGATPYAGVGDTPVIVWMALCVGILSLRSRLNA